MNSRLVLFIIALGSIAVLGLALYLQIYKDMQPCPLCIIQRYAFIGVAIFCLLGSAGNAPKIGGSAALLSSLSGIGVAGYHLWIKAHPGASCGIDPLETSLNRIATANLWPAMFRADGMCSTDYPPTFGLSIPQWSMTAFVLITLMLLWVVLRRR